MKDLCDNGNSQFLKPTFQFLQGMNEFVEINTTEKKNSVQQVPFKSKKFFLSLTVIESIGTISCYSVWLNIVLKRTYVGSAAVNDILLHNLSGNYLKRD